MKKIFVFVCVQLWLIFFCFSIFAQDFRTIQSGVEYAEMTRGTKEEPVHINLLRLDLKKVRLDVVHAMDAAIGLEKTSSMATRYGAIAAINGGFFRIDNSIFRGDETGVLQIDGKILSESYGGRIALLISNDFVPIDVSAINPVKGQYYFAKTNETVVSMERLESSNKFVIDKESFEILGINRQRKENDLVVFTPEFNRSTLTDSNGVEVIVRKNKISEIRNGGGSSIIPFDGFVISASGTKRAEILKKVKVKRKIELNLENFAFGTLPDGKSTYKSIVQAEDIIGGVPQLIRNGKIDIPWEQEKSSKAFVETRHPRTAVAKLKDGKFLMVTIDGRQEGYSVGMNLNELAAFFVEMGATDAMNLDGGGSTTMFLEGKVVNRPSDKEGERSVGDAILVFPRK
jgi:hypothetical protein